MTIILNNMKYQNNCWSKPTKILPKKIAKKRRKTITN